MFLLSSLPFTFVCLLPSWVKKIPAEFIDGVFEVIRKRYEAGSIIITSNRNFEDWSNIFGDAVMASAIVDRLVHHAFIIKIDGDSFRTKNFVYDN